MYCLQIFPMGKAITQKQKEDAQIAWSEGITDLDGVLILWSLSSFRLYVRTAFDLSDIVTYMLSIYYSGNARNSCFTFNQK